MEAVKAVPVTGNNGSLLTFIRTVEDFCGLSRLNADLKNRLWFEVEAIFCISLVNFVGFLLFMQEKSGLTLTAGEQIRRLWFLLVRHSTSR